MLRIWSDGNQNSHARNNNNGIKSVIWNQILYSFTGSNNNEMIVLICSLTLIHFVEHGSQTITTSGTKHSNQCEHVSETHALRLCALHTHTHTDPTLPTCPIIASVYIVNYFKLSVIFSFDSHFFPDFFTLFSIHSSVSSPHFFCFSLLFRCCRFCFCVRFGCISFDFYLVSSKCANWAQSNSITIEFCVWPGKKIRKKETDSLSFDTWYMEECVVVRVIQRL